MRVGFDCSPLLFPHPPGVVRVARELLAALEARGRIEVVRIEPPAGASLKRWRQRELARAPSELELAGLHSFVSAFALCGTGARVQTVHELPWRHGVRENADLAHRFWAWIGPLRAERVLVPSEHVARDLRRRLSPGAGRVRVCMWGVSSRFADEPPPGVVDEVLLGRYRLPAGPLALALGAVRPKKDLAALLHGLAALRERGGRMPHLVVTGPDTPQLRRDLGLASRLGLARYVSTPGEIEEEHLPGLLRLASVVPVLSRSEGFGLPVLEALACGTPVVVPPASAQAEVAGERAILADPRDPSSVADALERALREREELRYALADRARELSWERTAAQVEETWRELAR